MMPAANAQAMAPFFARLPSLSPAQKAAAVHFGRFPSDGRATRFASNVDTRADPGALALAGATSRSGAAPAARRAAQRGAAPPPRRRGRPGRDRDRRGRAGGRAAPPVEVAQDEPRRFEPPPAEPDRTRPSRSGRAEPSPRRRSSRPREAPAFAPGAHLHASSRAAATSRRARAAPSARRPGARRAGADFGDVAALVQSLPEERATPRRGAPPGRRRRRRAQRPPGARCRAARPRSRSGRDAPPANPARHWVQLAHASAQSVLPREFAAARDEAPALLGSRTAYVALTNRVNRLLVGPFDSEARRAGLRQPARPAPCRGNCLDKPGGPGDRAAPDRQ